MPAKKTKRWGWEKGHRQQFRDGASELGHRHLTTEAVLMGKCEVVQIRCTDCGGEMHFGATWSSSCSAIDLRSATCPASVEHYHEDPVIDATIAQIRRLEATAAKLVIDHIAKCVRAKHPTAVAVRYEAIAPHTAEPGSWELHVGEVVLAHGSTASSEEIEVTLDCDLGLLLSLEIGYVREDDRVDFSPAAA